MPATKMPFLQLWHPLWLGLWLALGTRSAGSQEVAFEMQRDNILAMFPSVWVFALGNWLLCPMYKQRSLLGGAWGRGMFCVQGPNDSDGAPPALYGKKSWPTLAFMGGEECESKIKFTQLRGWPPLLCGMSLCMLMSAMTLRKEPFTCTATNS